MATRVAIWELAANTGASNFLFTVLASKKPTVPVWELVDFVGRHAALAFLLTKQDRTTCMPTPRTKSISTKVTDEEYTLFEGLAGDQTISEWVRAVLLETAKPGLAEQTIVAEVQLFQHACRLRTQLCHSQTRGLAHVSLATNW
jgi:hypothetical protein